MTASELSISTVPHWDDVFRYLSHPSAYTCPPLAHIVRLSIFHLPPFFLWQNQYDSLIQTKAFNVGSSNLLYALHVRCVQGDSAAAACEPKRLQPPTVARSRDPCTVDAAYRRCGVTVLFTGSQRPGAREEGRRRRKRTSHIIPIVLPSLSLKRNRSHHCYHCHRCH